MESMELWGSYVLSALSLGVMWLAGKKMWQAWALGLANQALWLTFAVTTGQYGFLVATFPFATVYFLNLVRWRRHAATDRLYCPGCNGAGEHSTWTNMPGTIGRVEIVPCWACNGVGTVA